MCQCPNSGQPHFYPNSFPAQRQTIARCQCPNSGQPHFYIEHHSPMREPMKCVNALTRANPISTKLYPTVFRHNGRCQCPNSGQPHFYPQVWQAASTAASRAHFYVEFTEYSDNKLFQLLNLAVHTLFIFMHSIISEQAAFFNINITKICLISPHSPTQTPLPDIQS